MRRLSHIAVVLGFLWPMHAWADDPLPRSVLILSQGLPGGPWPSAVYQSIRSTLASSGTKPVSEYIEELDLGRFGSPEYEQLLHVHFRGKYRQIPIGVVVAIGSDALELLLRLRVDLWPNVPVVFGGVDELTASQLSLPRDVTGTTMRLSIGDAINAAKILSPKFEKIVLVGGPLEKDPYRGHLQQELPSFLNRLEFVNASETTMAEIRERVSKLSDSAVIYYTAIYADRAGAAYRPRDALRIVAETASRPIVVDAETSLGAGATGGFVISPTVVGQDTGQRVLRLLDGESAANIPITAGRSTKLVFDWRQLKRWNIAESSLPAESEVRFRPPTMWEQYSSQMTITFGAVLLQAAMIAWLLLEHSRRKTAELELRTRLREVLHLDRVATVGAMSSSIAHELNQPLGAILANAEAAELLLGRNPIDRDQLLEIVSDIRQSDQRAGEIISRLRGLLKKYGDAELRTFDLKEAIHEALHLVQPEARKRGVQVSESSVQGEVLVHAERVHLQQVMINLATNAMDAMESCAAGKRIMTVRTALVGDAQVEVSIFDSGTGIPYDKLDGVFETFYTTKQQGTGLGLSIVRTIVENCGGRIWAENGQDGGAVFRFTLPVSGASPA